MREKRLVSAGAGTSTEGNGSDGADGLLIGDAHVAALRFSLNGHFRNDGNAHPRADHAEEAAELAALENNLRMEPRAVTGGDGGIAETVAVAQKQKKARHAGL